MDQIVKENNKTISKKTKWKYHIFPINNKCQSITYAFFPLDIRGFTVDICKKDAFSKLAFETNAVFTRSINHF